VVAQYTDARSFVRDTHYWGHIRIVNGEPAPYLEYVSRTADALERCNLLDPLERMIACPVDFIALAAVAHEVGIPTELVHRIAVARRAIVLHAPNAIIDDLN